MASRVHSLVQHQRGRLVAAMLVGFLLGGMFVAMLGFGSGDFGRPDRDGTGNFHTRDGDGPPMGRMGPMGPMGPMGQQGGHP